MAQENESNFEPGETAGEAKAEIGICDWNDPDTGGRQQKRAPVLRSTVVKLQ